MNKWKLMRLRKCQRTHINISSNKWFNRMGYWMSRESDDRRRIGDFSSNFELFCCDHFRTDDRERHEPISLPAQPHLLQNKLESLRNGLLRIQNSEKNEKPFQNLSPEVVAIHRRRQIFGTPRLHLTGTWH